MFGLDKIIDSRIQDLIHKISEETGEPISEIKVLLTLDKETGKTIAYSVVNGKAGRRISLKEV
jgi:hypothetical protein